MAHLPWFPAEKLHSFVPSDISTPSTWSSLQLHPKQPLSGLKVLCVTHATAGLSAGRTLAEHGASVLQVMFTHGFEHSFVYTYANLGSASMRLNLHKAADRKRLQTLIRDAHFWIDSYFSFAIDKFDFSYERIQKVNPGIIICRIRCYGTTGLWAAKPINDYTTGYSASLAIQSILLKRITKLVDPAQ